MKSAVSAVIALILLPIALVASFAIGLTVGVGATSGDASCVPAIAADASPPPPATSKTAAGTDQEAIFQAVVAKANGDNKVILSMMQGSWLESRWNRNASDGEAYGPYQIQMPGVVHPDVSIAEAKDPVFSTNYMYEEYAEKAQAVDPNLWITDPQSAAELTAYRAERPKYIYSDSRSQGPAKVAEAFRAAADLLQAHGISLDFGQTAAAPAAPDVRTVAARSEPVQQCAADEQKGKEADAAQVSLVSSGWTKPVTADGVRCTSGFGPRWSTQHNGVDLANGRLGTPIYAAAGGTVIASGPASGFGWWIVIDHGNGIVTIYGHMNGKDLLVSVGDVVTPGKPISRIGNEGQSTGPHLHFGVKEGGISGKSIDPEKFMAERGVALCDGSAA